ncbi:Regulator of telomere elongation helicase 1 homolog [Gryllus bimaculatus]|nr:Regulator of telomere elongation helicase 1 homolog [Gryllus bimaculatus]
MGPYSLRGTLKDNILEPPHEFPFPFTPYPIQQDFMTALYVALEGSKLGIFESPTGTGKSMSMICGALTWLEDNEKRIHHSLELAAATTVGVSDGDEDWITEQARQLEEAAIRAEKKKQLILLEAKVKEMEIIAKKVIARRKNSESKKLLSTTIQTKRDEEKVKEDTDDDLLLEDYSEVMDEKTEEEGDENKEEYVVTKIFFCSRTHSQLSQLVSELRRSVHSDKRVTCLASRQSYCINPSVRSLGNLSLINDRCLDLQEGRTSTARDKDGCTTKRARRCGGCPQKAQERVQALRDEILVEVSDVEELVKKGTELKACPYYAARAALKDAQVVLLPYNTLLHAATRETVGISLAGNIVIIDEAHNLLDTIAHMHSAEVTGQQLSDALTQLNAYRSRYESRFSAINMLRLDQLIFYIERLLRILRTNITKGQITPANAYKGPVTTVYQLMDFATAAGVESINPYLLLEFCLKSKLAHKLRGFANKGPSVVQVHERKPTGLKAFLDGIQKGNTEPTVDEEPSDSTNEPVSKNAILPILSFLECLMSRSGDGRVVCSQQATLGASRLKFLLLNPAEYFKSVVQEARAVIVAGGTMQPLSEFRDQLFRAAGGSSDRLAQFSCDHIVPPENILPIALVKGPTGRELNFSYETRSLPDMILEVERILSNVCNIVPGGIVCFFPSYDYEQQVFSFMQKSGTLEKLQLKKKIFREPKKSSQVDQVLRDYALAINRSKSSDRKGGALMLSVVGGKLSEGLNFSDDLGRLVIVVGMPYPNSKSPELQEKMNYLNTHMGAGTGQKHYEALCMKAVNQSIGRAIRHREDYATVLLVDKRYIRPSVQAGLPGWIQRSLRSCDKFGQALAQIRQFFLNKKAH